MANRRRVVVIGGGFGGLATAHGLRRADVDVLVIDRQNHHLFQPLLYQVATAGLAPGDIAEPIRRILSRQRNAATRLGEVVAIDPDARTVTLGDGTVEAWDALVVAAGARHAYFGHDEWEVDAPGLKTIGDALDIRRRILTAFERAEWAEDPAERERLCTFVVVGAGPTGVELAGAIQEIALRTLRRDFRHIDTERTRVVLVEAADRVLGAMSPDLQARARKQLERLGVEVRLGEPVTHIDATGVAIGDERIEAGTVIWAAGVEASPLGKQLGAEVDRAGRVKVAPDLSVPGHPDVFVIGDLAHAARDGDRPVPGVAPAAIQMGKHVARVIRTGERSPFRYVDRGTMATIGRKLAVADVGGIRFAGYLAWLAWVFVHLMTLVGFRNRLVVFVKWAWAWFTFEQSSRLVWRGPVTAERAGDVPEKVATTHHNR